MNNELKEQKHIKHFQSRHIVIVCAAVLAIVLGLLIFIEPHAACQENCEHCLEKATETPTVNISEEPTTTISEVPTATLRPTLSPEWHQTINPIIVPERTPDPVEEYEEAVIYIAKTVWGEARGCSVTEQAAVIWCILNRVDQGDTYTQDDVIKVITAKYQFTGYRAKNPVKDEHYELAKDVLGRWLREKAGEENVGRVLPKEYTFFAGDGKHNHFRDAWRGGNYWDWSLESPYED